MQSKELAPGASQKLMEHLKGQVQFIGLVKHRLPEGEEEYLNLILDVSGGKVIYVKELPPTYTQDQAINQAFGWIEQKYWEE
jgi:hypothetical protein